MAVGELKCKSEPKMATLAAVWKSAFDGMRKSTYAIFWILRIRKTCVEGNQKACELRLILTVNSTKAKSELHALRSLVFLHYLRARAQISADRFW
jgi:hypothetical protein